MSINQVIPIAYIMLRNKLVAHFAKYLAQRYMGDRIKLCIQSTFASGSRLMEIIHIHLKKMIYFSECMVLDCTYLTEEHSVSY